MFNILLVEDNGATQILLKKVLTRKFHCTVTTAEDGKEALKLISMNKPDFIILDYMMPHMNGYEFLQEVRNRQICLDIPIMMVTAVNEKVAFQKVISLGVSDYILKPLNIELTLEKIARIMWDRNKEMVRRVDRLKRRIDFLEKQNEFLKKNKTNISWKDIKISLN